MITSSIISLFLLQTPTASAMAVFTQTLARYEKLDSFSTDIEHDFSSGLFPGQYKQHLEFKRGKGFKLVVTSLRVAAIKDKIAPDYYCDGVNVTTVGRFDGTQPINKDANSSPGYEVSGGLIMTWLLDSPLKGLLDKPREGMKIEADWGPRKLWHDEKVDEIIFKVTMGGDSTVSHFFLDPDHKRLIGNEWFNVSKLGYKIYRNQKENPLVNPGSFKPPG